MDNITHYIQMKLIENNLENRVNVIHLSDHGMQGVPLRNAIILWDFVDKEKCSMYGASPVFQIVPNSGENTFTKQYFFHNLRNYCTSDQSLGYEDEVFMNLTEAAKQNGHFRVYHLEDLPKRWHANHNRLGPIVAVADGGYAFQDLKESVDANIAGG